MKSNCVFNDLTGKFVLSLIDKGNPIFIEIIPGEMQQLAFEINTAIESHLRERIKEEEQKFLTCNVCHKSKSTVSIRACAFQAEINNDHEYTEQICDDCEQEHRDGI